MMAEVAAIMEFVEVYKRKINFAQIK